MKHYIKYLWHITEGFHRAAILRTLLGVFQVGITLTFIWLSKTVIDCATGKIPVATRTLIWLFAAMVACLLTNILLSQWARYIESRATLQMNNRVNRRLFNILMVMPLVRGQQGFHSGDMLNRLTLDVRTVSNFALTQLPAMIVMVVQLIGAFIFLACLNPYLALAPIIIMPVCVLASKLYFRRQRRLTAEIREGESNMHVTIQEGLKHRILLRTLECIDVIDRRLGDIQQQLDATNKEQTKLSRISSSIVKLGFALGYLTAFGWSIFSLRAGIITYGTMMAFIQLVNRIQNPIANLSGYIPTFISTSVAIDRLRAIDLPLNPQLSTLNSSPSSCGEGRGGVHLNSPLLTLPLRGGMGRGSSQLSTLPCAGVRVKDLSFRYESEGRDILSRFSHDFRPGSRTMIVGSTGAGKTTLIKLLLGLLQPDAGTIEIYQAASPSALRPPLSAQSGEAGLSQGENSALRSPLSAIGHFAYVPQGNSLLHGTIRENLLLAAPQASDEQLALALHIAAADFVFDLPLGLDTSCDEAGGGLSEGQAQRIAIARALLRPGSIMLLDEFNSALDADTAATVMQRLADARPDATIIIIAHHRSAIAPYCHDILRIDTEG